jgi:hypothetical protein
MDSSRFYGIICPERTDAISSKWEGDEMDATTIWLWRFVTSRTAAC